MKGTLLTFPMKLKRMHLLFLNYRKPSLSISFELRGIHPIFSKNLRGIRFISPQTEEDRLHFSFKLSDTHSTSSPKLRETCSTFPLFPELRGGSLFFPPTKGKLSTSSFKVSEIYINFLL